MKILKRKKVSPICLAPGDTIHLTYGDDHRVLLSESIGRNMTVDEAIVFNLEQDELDDLGLEDAIGGLFGKSSD